MTYEEYDQVVMFLSKQGRIFVPHGTLRGFDHKSRKTAFSTLEIAFGKYTGMFLSGEERRIDLGPRAPWKTSAGDRLRYLGVTVCQVSELPDEWRAEILRGVSGVTDREFIVQDLRLYIQPDVGV